MTTLTNSQLITIKAAVQANPTANGFLQAQDTFSLKEWLNANSSTDAWKISVPGIDIDEACNWTVFDTLSAGKRDSWKMFFNLDQDRGRNFTRNKVRKWVTDIWGPATANSDSAAILSAGIEKATRAQNILGGTIRTTDSVSALEREYLSLVDQDDVNKLVVL